MYYVYVLHSLKDGQWYTGATADLRARLKRHQAGEVPATRNRQPLELIYYEASLSRDDAFRRERFLKSGKGKRYLKQRLSRWLGGTPRDET